MKKRGRAIITRSAKEAVTTRMTIGDFFDASFLAIAGGAGVSGGDAVRRPEKTMVPFMADSGRFIVGGITGLAIGGGGALGAAGADGADTGARLAAGAEGFR